jgi:hypothetical protein
MTRSAVSEVRAQAGEVRALAGEVRMGLLNPAEAGDFAAEILKLNAAIDRLREVKEHVAVVRPGSEERIALETDLRALREDLARLAMLSGYGEAFWRGWARIMGLDTSGYTHAGHPASLSAEPAAVTTVVA